MTHSALVDTTGLDSLLTVGYLNSNDVSVPVIEVLAPLYFTAVGHMQSFENRELQLEAKLAQLKFATDSTHSAPDGSSSLRLADGVVRGYDYNGTKAPAFTTFYGLYDHYYSYRYLSLSWDLPTRWQQPPRPIELSVPINLVSTNDAWRGNSGSPLLNSNLEIVGLVYGGNIEKVSTVYMFSDRMARTVSVDSRGVLEALDKVYGADHLINEILTPAE